MYNLFILVTLLSETGLIHFTSPVGTWPAIIGLNLITEGEKQKQKEDERENKGKRQGRVREVKKGKKGA